VSAQKGGKEEHQLETLMTDPESLLNLVKEHTPALNQSQRMFSTNCLIQEEVELF
jgi:hypothetical protein